MDTEAALSHAYIISAPPEEGYLAARELAKAMLCTGTEKRPCGLCENCRKAENGSHPDVITVTRLPDDKGRPKREIVVDQIRDLVRDVFILPNEAEKKVYIIRDAGTMNAAAQNALLKILEEPPYFAAFILVADTADTLLETVRSRCVIRYLNGGDTLSAEAQSMAEQFIGFAAAGAKLSLISFANGYGDLGNAEMLEFVRAARSRLTDMLCGRLPAMKLSRPELMRLAELMRTAEQYLRFNVSTKHVLGLLSAEAAGEHGKNK